MPNCNIKSIGKTINHKLILALRNAIMSSSASEIAIASRVLSDKTRVKIFSMLSSGPKCAQAITSNLELGQTTVSNHLIKMKTCGMLKAERKGRFVYYSIPN